jgi:hypothetical protein
MPQPLQSREEELLDRINEQKRYIATLEKQVESLEKKCSELDAELDKAKNDSDTNGFEQFSDPLTVETNRSKMLKEQWKQQRNNSCKTPDSVTTYYDEYAKAKKAYDNSPIDDWRFDNRMG